MSPLVLKILNIIDIVSLCLAIVAVCTCIVFRFSVIDCCAIPWDSLVFNAYSKNGCVDGIVQRLKTYKDPDLQFDIKVGIAMVHGLVKEHLKK